MVTMLQLIFPAQLMIGVLYRNHWVFPLKLCHYMSIICQSWSIFTNFHGSSLSFLCGEQISLLSFSGISSSLCLSRIWKLQKKSYHNIGIAQPWLFVEMWWFLAKRFCNDKSLLHKWVGIRTLPLYISNNINE